VQGSDAHLPADDGKIEKTREKEETDEGVDEDKIHLSVESSTFECLPDYQLD
jgi:hypothetical protein